MKSNEPTSEKKPGRWQAIRLMKTDHMDLVCILGLILSGLLAAWSGQMMGFYMTPGEAVKTSQMLDALELPRQLTNQPVITENKQHYMLWDLLQSERSIISVFASWCPACRKELPLLAENLSEGDNLVVLVSRNQDFQEARSQLDNLGFTELIFYKDISGDILKEAKVTKLPTTFLVKPYGKVLDRVIGLSKYRLRRLAEKARIEKNDIDADQQ